MPVIDFRNTTQVFYGRNNIREVWFRGEKLWQKATPEITILQANAVSVRKRAGVILIKVTPSQWRKRRAENINGKHIYFDTEKYAIKFAEVNDVLISLELNSGLENIVNDRTYNIKIVE